MVRGVQLTPPERIWFKFNIENGNARGLFVFNVKDIEKSQNLTLVLIKFT